MGGPDRKATTSLLGAWSIVKYRDSTENQLGIHPFEYAPDYHLTCIRPEPTGHDIECLQYSYLITNLRALP
jgi:hypothetical protein